MSRSPKLVIADQSLRDRNGHHFEYVLSAAEAAQAMGMLPITAVHRKCDPGLASLLPSVRRHFSRSWNEVHHKAADRVIRSLLSPLPAEVRALAITVGSAAKKMVRVPSRREEFPQALPSFGAELADLVAEERLAPSDHVLIHTLSVAELHSLIEAFPLCPSLPAFHIILRRDAEEPAVQDDAWGGIRTAFSKIRANPRLKAHLKFYSDTEQLCRQYAALSPDVSIRLLPIPHGLANGLAAPQRAAERAVCATYLGNARTEKGFHYLPDAIDALRASHIETGRLRFVVQANANLSLEDAIITAARRRLARHGADKVTLLRQALTVSEFQRCLIQSDLILLPYQPECYRRRSSGILVQALVCGLPVVVPRRTWLAEVAPPEASVPFDGPEDLASAVAVAVERIDELQRAARHVAPGWRRVHNAQALVQALLTP